MYFGNTAVLLAVQSVMYNFSTVCDAFTKIALLLAVHFECMMFNFVAVCDV